MNAPPKLHHDVISLMAGRVTAEQLAERHGVDVTEVERWRALYLAGLEHAALQSRPARRWPAVAVAGALVAVSLIVAKTAAAQASCAQTLPAPLRTFCPDEPALASEVNGNTQQLVDWVQQKVGPVGAPVTIDGGVLASRLTLRYADFGSAATGAGGMVIVNDNASQYALVVAGNTSAGGVRRVRLMDDVSVTGTLTAAAVTSTTPVTGTILGGAISNCNGNSSVFRLCQSAWGAASCTAACSNVTCSQGTPRQVSNGACYNVTDGMGGYCYGVLCVQ